VEVIALEIAPWMKHTIGAVNAAQGVLAALRAEGFEWYRPNECETEPVMDTDSIPADAPIPEGWHEILDAGDRRLIGRVTSWFYRIPIPVETPKENE